jgi:hypothetical protein
LTNKQLAVDEKQVTLDEWVLERFRDKLKKSALVTKRSGKPLVLYRRTIEESECAGEEEIGTLISEKYALVQVYTHGGFIPLSFQQQFVLSLDEFPKWVTRRSRELVIQCLEAMEEELEKI